MNWEHKVSRGWMEARRNCLTATDIKELLPFTKTGRQRKVTDDDYMKVMARKLAPITDEQCYSYGAAARGHVLEPYAIEVFNNCSPYGPYFHWDDIVVKQDIFEDFGLGFSPDGLDRPAPINSLYQTVDLTDSHTVTSESVIEIKCYGAERHLVTLEKQAEELEERWQLAVAMATIPNLKYGRLFLYNPSMPEGYRHHIFTYGRHDLQDEIDIVCDIAKTWKHFVKKHGFTKKLIRPYESTDEAEIIRKIEEDNKFNP